MVRPRSMHVSSGSSDSDTEWLHVGEAIGKKSVVGHVLTAIAALAVGVVVLAMTNLHLALDPEEVAAWVGPRASAALNRPVTLGEAGISLWPRPSLNVSDVRVGNLSDFHGPSLAQIESVRLDVAWLPLIVGRVDIRRLVMDGARVHMAIDEHGTSNFGDLVPRSGEPAVGLPAPVALRIREIALSDASVTYFDAQGARSLMVSGLEAQAALPGSEAGGWQSIVVARSDSMLVRIAGVGDEVVRSAGPSAVVRARSGEDRNTIKIDEGQLAFAHDTLVVYGQVALIEPAPQFDLLLTDEDLSAGFLTALFPMESRSELLPLVEGTLSVMLQLYGGAGEPASLRGAVRLDDVGVRVRGEPLAARVSGLVSITPDTITFDSLAGSFADGPFDISGTVARQADVAAFVARGEPDLDSFDRLGLLPDGMTLSGKADLYVSIAGPASALDSIEVVGVAALTGLQLELAELGVPLYIPSGEISLVGREARWSELPVLVGRDPVITSGSIRDFFDFWPGSERAPYVEASLAAARLDLNAALPARDSTSQATYTQLALAHLGGRLVDGRTASMIATTREMSRPKRLPARGTLAVSVDTMVVRHHVLERLTAHLELGDSELSVPEASFDAWGGHVTSSLGMGVGAEREAPFALALALEHAEAEPFLAAMTPLGNVISGTLDLRLEVAGATDATLLPVAHDMTGDVFMTITDGAMEGSGVNLALADFLGADAWSNITFSRWVIDMRIEDRVLDIRQADLEAELGHVAIGGPLRLDGSADLSVGLSIPPEHLTDVSLRRTGIAESVLDQLRSAGESLDLGLRLSGWLQAPTLEPDASTAGASAH